MGNRKIYSINLIAYIIYSTDYAPQLALDDNGKVYAVFPTTAAIQEAIDDFKNTNPYVNLHQLLDCFRVIRKGMASIRRGEL